MHQQMPLSSSTLEILLVSLECLPWASSDSFPYVYSSLILRGHRHTNLTLILNSRPIHRSGLLNMALQASDAAHYHLYVAIGIRWTDLFHLYIPLHLQIAQVSAQECYYGLIVVA